MTKNKEMIDKAKKALSNLQYRSYDLKKRLSNTEFLIKQGIDYIQDLPERWYVENPNDNVITYLREMGIIDLEFTYEDCGYGMIHGEYAFIPHDINYTWEISQDVFDYFYYNIYKKEENEN